MPLLLLALALSACDGPDAFLMRRKVVLNDKVIYVHPDNPIEIPAGNTVHIEKSTITVKGNEMITIRNLTVGVRGNTVIIGTSQYDADAIQKITIDRDGVVKTEMGGAGR